MQKVYSRLHIMWRKRRNKNNLKCIYLYLSFPGDSADKESACYTGDLGSIPGLGKSPREGKGYPLWYSGLENFMDCIIHGVAKSQTWVSDFHFTIYLGIRSEVHPYCSMCKNFLHLNNNIALYVYTFCFSIHSLTDTWVVSTFWLLWIVLL